MSLLTDAKMPSLKDKIKAQEAEAELLREKVEKKDEKSAKVVLKKSRKN